MSRIYYPSAVGVPKIHIFALSLNAQIHMQRYSRWCFVHQPLHLCDALKLHLRITLVFSIAWSVRLFQNLSEYTSLNNVRYQLLWSSQLQDGIDWNSCVLMLCKCLRFYKIEECTHAKIWRHAWRCVWDIISVTYAVYLGSSLEFCDNVLPNVSRKIDWRKASSKNSFW